MTDTRNNDIATIPRSEPTAVQSVNRPLSTADLASVEQPVQANDITQSPTQDQMRAEGGFPPRVPPMAMQNPADEKAPLFAHDRAQDFRSRWNTIQTGFVDEPRRTVEQADTLVAEVIQQLAKSFADERGKLEHDWSRGNDVSTEDLRLGLRRYRSFFDRLLTM
jgi:hypothetical protein